ncbi:reverse transcriptase domain-containing protein [Tanacetum coccineum]
MTPESIQAMIGQALLRNSTNGDGSHSSHGDNRRNSANCAPFGCAIENQVKFATCTMLGDALTWWNGQIRTLGPEAYTMTWEVLKKKMMDKYYPQGEIKKLEIKLWNLKFVANETKKVDKYISGLPDNIYGNVKSAKPKTLDETIELTRPTGGRGVDYGFVSTVDAEARRQGISEVGYGVRDTWVDPAEAVPEVAPMTLGEVNTRVTEIVELHEHDTHDLYALLEDAQDSRSRISQRVDMDSQRVDLLMGDRMTLQETVWMVEEEAYASREAWAHSIGLSQATHHEIQTHRDHVYAHETHLQAHQTQLQLQGTLIQTQHQVYETRFQMQQVEIAVLRETDCRRQARMVETLHVMRYMRREMADMQNELLALQGQRRARQPAPDARIQNHQMVQGCDVTLVVMSILSCCHVQQVK